MKKVIKPLSLKKETVSLLTDQEQNKLRGGSTLAACGFTKTMMVYYTSNCGDPCEPHE